MLKECIEIFNKESESVIDKKIADTYVPADGTYILLERAGESYKIKEHFNIKYDKKTKRILGSENEYFKEICNFDYNSILVEMNKPIDQKKIIHSNNYLSFFIKKESLINGKLTNEVIENYYSILKNPALKYKNKPKAKAAYESIEKVIGEVDCDEVEKIKIWIKNNIFNLDKELTEGKDYLKIFFDYPLNDYKREGKRYLIPNIYNSNDFNVTIKDKLYGLPSNNMGMNSKKPYLENKTRNIKVPYLINSKEVLSQKKFFDYLMNLACVGQVNIYIDNEINGYENGEMIDRDFQGIFLRIAKGKEVEIHDYDLISSFKVDLPRAFNFQNYLKLDLENKKVSTEEYGKYYRIKEFQGLINRVLFNKLLNNNYFTEVDKISINDNNIKKNLLISRKVLFNFFYKGINEGVYKVIDKVSLDLIKGSIVNNHVMKAKHQFNLRWSILEFYGGLDMAEVLENTINSVKEKINAVNYEPIENDKEYYFAVGQAVSYLLSKYKGKNKPLSLASPFTNAKSNKAIKENLLKMYNKYSYDPSINVKRFKNLYVLVTGYEPEGKVNQDMIIAGFLSNNLVYEKKEDVENDK